MKKHTVLATHRVHVVYTGRVQDLDLCGCVKNMPDGSVDLVCEGSKDKIETLLRCIQEGSLGPHIKKTDCHWEKPTQQYTEFSVEFCF